MARITPSTKESTRQFLERRFWDLASDQQTWRDHWKELSDFVLPRTSRYLESGYGGVGNSSSFIGTANTNPNRGSRSDNYGGKLNQKILDGTASHAITTISSGLMSGVTNPSRRWFALETSRSNEMANKEALKWISHVEQTMLEIFEVSNLYKLLPYVYEDLALYGTSALGVFTDYEDVLRFEHYPVGSYWLSQNHKYQIDTFFRIILKTVEQLVEEFCMDAGEIDPAQFDMLSLAAQDSWREGRYGDRFECMECIVPASKRKFTDGGDMEHGDFPFIHMVYERSSPDESSKDKMPRLLHKGGFNRFPILVPRWYLNTPDVYGRSPGMMVLGDVKQLQRQSQVKHAALEKHVNPPLNAPGTLKDTKVSLVPGGVNYVEGVNQGLQGVQPVYQVEPRLDHFTADLKELQVRIGRHLYSDLFEIISQLQGSGITATQIRAMQDEKFLLLGPIMLSLDDDLLKPLIDLSFEKMDEANLIPRPWPNELQGQRLIPRYLSIIAMAQRAESREILNLYAQMVYAIALQQGQVEQLGVSTAADFVNADKLINKFGRQLGIDPDIIRSEKEVAQVRAARIQTQQQAQLAQSLPQLADMAQKLGTVSTGNEGGDNVGSDIVQSMAGGRNSYERGRGA